MMFVPVCMVSILLFVLFFIILYNYLYSLILSSLLGRYLLSMLCILVCFVLVIMMINVRFCLGSLLVGLSLLGLAFGILFIGFVVILEMIFRMCAIFGLICLLMLMILSSGSRRIICYYLPILTLNLFVIIKDLA